MRPKIIAIWFAAAQTASSAPLTFEVASVKLAATGCQGHPNPIGPALQEELGLKLVKGTGPVEVLVIDPMEKASEN